MMTMEQVEHYIMERWKQYEHLPDRDSYPESHAYTAAWICWSSVDSVPEMLTLMEDAERDVASYLDNERHEAFVKELLNWYQIIIDTIKGEETTPS